MPVNKKQKRAVLVYAIYVIVLGLAQAMWPDSLSVLGAKPDLTLVLAVLCGYMFGLEDGILVGLSAGFIRDALAGRSLGLGMLLLMYAALIASVLFKRQFNRSLPMGLVQILIITVLYQVVLTGSTFLFPMLSGVAYNLTDLLLDSIDKLPGMLAANLITSVLLIFLLRYLGPYRRGSRMDDPEQTILGGSVWQVE